MTFLTSIYIDTHIHIKKYMILLLLLLLLLSLLFLVSQIII